MLDNNKSGSILILTLWTLSFLSVLAVQIGLTIQKRSALVAHIEERNQLHNMANSGIKKAIAVLSRDIEENGNSYNISRKLSLHNNISDFSEIKLGKGFSEVFYDYFQDFGMSSIKMFGLEDEESKININTADGLTLARLMKDVLSVSEDDAESLAVAIIDWSEPGKIELNGYYSDDYYYNLEVPYKTKDDKFELIDELSLIRGFSPVFIDKLKPFITVYGDGLVNINTASKQVLIALGLDESSADKLINVRKGPDGFEFTSDDYIFSKTFDVASEVKKQLKLSAEEVRQLDMLNSKGKIKTNSFFYLIRSKGKIKEKDEGFVISCVYNTLDKTIEYWSEK